MLRVVILISGLPTGYITALERRLTETESALYAVLCTKHDDRTPSAASLARATIEEASRQITMANEQTPRSTRLASWNSLPLACDSDLESWRAEIRKLLDSRSATTRFQRHEGIVPANPDAAPWAQSDGPIHEHVVMPSHSYSVHNGGATVSSGESQLTEALSRLTPLDRRKYF